MFRSSVDILHNFGPDDVVVVWTLEEDAAVIERLRMGVALTYTLDHVDGQTSVVYL